MQSDTRETVNLAGLELIDAYYRKHPVVERICGAQIFDPDTKAPPCFMKNCIGSALPFVVKAIAQKKDSPVLILTDDKENAAYILNDLENIASEKKGMIFPSSYKRNLKKDLLDTESLVLRTEVLSALLSQSPPDFIVSYYQAVAEMVVTPANLKKNTLKISHGEQVGIDFVVEVLNEYQFVRTDFVFEPGQFAVRGSIVDVFGFSYDLPFRIDFFGDEIESIRTFLPDSQLSQDQVDLLEIVPNIQTTESLLKENSLFDFLPADTIFYVQDFLPEIKSLEALRNELLDRILEDQDEMPPALLGFDVFQKKIKGHRVLEWGIKSSFNEAEVFEFNMSPQPEFNKNFELLSSNMVEHYNAGYINLVFSSNEKQIDRLQKIFNELNSLEVEEFSGVLFPIHKGFIDHNLQICFYTDHQIFERYHKYQIRTAFKARESISFAELAKLKPGDYVVHSDHGIGVFAGLSRIEKNGTYQEAVRLVYKDEDVLFVGIHNLHRISKYKGQEGAPPKVYKLGGGAWKKLKAKTKAKVKDIARELIHLYAQRKAKEGFRFSPDSYLQTELEASFIYEDTPDQNKSTQAIKSDMESATPMDRLVCGDVGFGKTELAIRAAFKAVADNKQVVVLVPTTILAMQHFYTFSDRLKEFPCTVDYISRLRNTGDQKQILKKLKEGKIDIIIGTHRLIGKDIEFKDLGLLVIDEEQKFGVAVKEKLKQIKVNVDTLTLTATPIPRTLQFSMMGARDLSLINTPPPNRFPINTEIHSFSSDIIKEAIQYEIGRNGQVFFIHNRIENIYEVEKLVNKLLPKIKTVVAHGQMKGPDLEKIMLGFIEGDYDVLISTTIIESGLDIPNANTIIVNNAHNFGLSDLHQLRGRVGRSNKKAFCYLISQPLHTLKPDARRRLKAIEEFSDLGSGFNIAMQDLDIRGAGNLLGAEQSGFISDIGYETYHKILDEAMLELRESEFKGLYPDEEKSDEENFVTDCNIETDLELLIPDTYIQNMSERLKIYRELDHLKDEDELQQFIHKLKDRFGPLPNQLDGLINLLRLRWLAIQLGMEKLILKAGIMICFYVSNKESRFYKSQSFVEMLNFVQNHQRRCQLKENNEKLSLRFLKVESVEDALKNLKMMLDKS